jgi:hypothetical protein
MRSSGFGVPFDPERIPVVALPEASARPGNSFSVSSSYFFSSKKSVSGNL